MAKEQRRAIPGHRPRRAPPVSEQITTVNLAERAEVTVVVRSKCSDEEWAKLLASSITGPPKQRRYLTRAEFGKKCGASRADLAKVRAFAQAFQLKVVSSDAWRRCVVVSGTIRQLKKAFAVEFYGVKHALGVFRTVREAPQVPESIFPIVEAVIGLDNLPSATPHLAKGSTTGGEPELHLRELRKVYSFPPKFSGKGQCVAVIELGGGLSRRDFKTYFARIGLAAPRLRIKTMPGVSNETAPPEAMEKLANEALNGPFWPIIPPNELAVWTWETAMDLQIVGTLAPEATLLLLLANGNDQGEYHAVTSVLGDARNAPSVISCSWSWPEWQMTPILMPVLNRWFQAAAILGVTVCYSAGDRGDGSVGKAPGQPLDYVTNFPGTSPYVLTCGGTTLDVEANTETAWNQRIGKLGLPMAGGGGFSDVFERPAWQDGERFNSAKWIPPNNTSGTGRGIPDVSAKANLDPAFCILAGTEIPAGGTSASAPLWAALIAVFNEALNCPVGCINPLLYEGGLHKALRDITEGNIGHLQAKVGWDPASGWGSPHGIAMLKALRGGK